MLLAEIITELRKFLAPEFVFGVGARHQAGRYAKNLGAGRALLVTDPGVIAVGWAGEVRASLEAEGIETVLFDGLTPNPKDREIMAGAEIYHQAECDCVVAVGGGSPIDCAKGIAIVVANGGRILDYEGVDLVPEPGPPLLCIPTTAGTAAELSQFAIVTDCANRTKIAIISKAIVPDLALVDPETTTTMDSFLTACTGMDALTHAIEATVSNANSLITDLHALKAVELLSQNLERAIAAPKDLHARQQVMLGCLEAGLAFSNASLGAVHAMAHSLGGYLDLPHGECNAILLPHVMEFNLPAAGEQFSRILQAMGLEARNLSSREKAAAILAEVGRLRRAIGIDRNLGNLGVHRTDVPELARHAERDPCLVTNPRSADRRDLEVIYEESL